MYSIKIQLVACTERRPPNKRMEPAAFGPQLIGSRWAAGTLASKPQKALA